MVGDILQPTHLLFILVVALLVLGPKRLPEVGRTLGSGLRDFRQAINGEATSHEQPAPQVYMEPEPEPVPPHDAVATDAEPTELPEHHGFATSDRDADVAPAAGDDLLPPSADDAPASAPGAPASGTGFASALAASRQQPAGGDEPAAHE